MVQGAVSASRCELQEHQLPLPSVPEVSHPLGVQLEEIPLEAVGCNVADRVRADESVSVACFWTAEAKLPRDLAVSVRLVDQASVEWARNDWQISGMAANAAPP